MFRVDPIGAQEPSLEALEAEITTLAAHLNAATCRFLLLVARFDEREGWVSSGARSCAHWLAWRCCMSAGTAREHVRVARRLGELPLIRAAFGSGELSFSQVRALTRVEQVTDEAQLLGLARAATAAQLERIVRAYRGCADPDAVRVQRERYLHVHHDEDGAVVIRARLSPEEGALVEAALQAAQDRLFVAERAAVAPTPAQGETPDARHEAWLTGREVAEAVDPVDEPGARSADALVAVADAYLAGCPDGPASGAERHQVVVHVDLDALAVGAEGRCELADGTPLAPAVARRLSCDASVVGSLERDGQALSIGRRARTIPAAVRRALAQRDRGCRFPGCTATRHVDAHHIQHWADGGETSVDNLVLLCRYHHRAIHEGGFTIARDAGGGLRFTTPRGRRLDPTPRPRRGDPGCLMTEHSRGGISIDHDTAVCRWAGDPLDLAAAVDVVLDAGRPPIQGAH